LPVNSGLFSTALLGEAFLVCRLPAEWRPESSLFQPALLQFQTADLKALYHFAALFVQTGAEALPAYNSRRLPAG